jgi:hypothetical protein
MKEAEVDVEPSVDCLDTDMNDVSFVRVTTMMRGRYAVKEFLACGVYPLSVNFSFKGVIDDTTVVSKVVVPSPSLSRGTDF